MKIFPTVLLFLIVSCQNEKERIYEGVESGILTYIEANSEFPIDSVSVRNVDTLTSESVNKMKQVFKLNDISLQDERLKNAQSILMLSADMGFDDFILEEYQNDVNEHQAALDKLNSEYVDLQKEARTTNDVVFKYFYATAVIYFMEKGAAKNVEVYLPLNSSFQVVELTDL